MERMARLSVVIPSFNTSDLTQKTLSSLIENFKNDTITWDIIVVDNASTDSSQKMLRDYQRKLGKDKLQLILNDVNEGYPKANNQAIHNVKADYVLLLNSDVIVSNVSFTTLIDSLDKDQTIAGLTVRVVLTNGQIDAASHRGFPTVWNSFCYFSKLEKLFGNVPFLNRLFGGYHLTYKNRLQRHEIDSPTGAFFLLRRSVLEEIKGFDEEFFMYGEDIDLSFRIKEKGYKIVYDPSYTVLHLKNISGLKNKNPEIQKKTRNYFYDSMAIFYRKHYEQHYPSFISKLVYFFIDFKRKHI